MNKNIIKASLTLLTLTGLAACSTLTNVTETGSTNGIEGTASAKPNIIYILADDLGHGEVGVYGQTLINTPNIDQLAIEGMRFTQHYSGSTVCAPTRSTILEGKHTGYSTVRGNWGTGEGREAGNYPLAQGTRTLGHMLQEQGYVTGIFGKWGLGSKSSSGHPAKQGFDFFSGYLDHKHAHNYYPGYIYRFGKEVDLDNDVKVRKLGKNKSLDYKSYIGNDYVPDLMLEDALQFMQQQQDKPFFLYYPLTIPHVALQATEDSLQEYLGKFKEIPYAGRGYTPHQYPRAAHAAMVTHMDKHIGQLMTELKRLGLEQNTIVMFSSDNGVSKAGGYDADFFNASVGLRGHKRDLYEGGIRVPMIAKWPAMIKAGTVTDHISAQWDLMATLADISGGSANSDSNGISFLPTLLGLREQNQHDHLYWEFWEKGGKQAVRMGDWKGVRLNASTNSEAPIELYNLAQDPFEINNVAANHPEIVTQIKQAMLDRIPSDHVSWNPGHKRGQ